MIWNSIFDGLVSRSPRCRFCRGRRSFTLVEALVSLTITAIAGEALMVAVVSTMDATDAALQQAIAEGMAQQLMDRVSRIVGEVGLNNHRSEPNVHVEYTTVRGVAPPCPVVRKLAVFAEMIGFLAAKIRKMLLELTCSLRRLWLR